VLVTWILTFVMTGVQISPTLKVNWWWQWSKASTEEYNAPMILDFFDKHYYFWLPLSQRSTSMYPCPSICTRISGHNNATFKKSYILPFLTLFFLFFSELYSFSFFCFWVLMYMYNMLLRFEKKNNILSKENGSHNKG
jgi:hypothetical protein